MAAPIPKKIGKYDVIDVVGRGGMGVVYRAKDPFLDRMVAIKIMTISYADYPDLLQRFYREAKATANLQHPNIVTVYELGEHEGSPYLAMQYLEGASLETMVRSGQELSLLQKIDIIVQACHGLSYAHQKGIVHRDIKPGNIMVLKDATVKIVDFGIARIGDTNFTRTGQFMGSLNYMSLEQLNDKLQVDQRTDVYSTGVVLYQILTGALPFEADSTGATLMKILNEQPAPFSKYLSNFPPEIETITMKALAKDRDQRYSSADELALELTQLQDRLKTDQISIHMQQAEALLQQNNLFQANDELLAVLKLDKQHTKASALLRTLRKQIEKEQSAERSRQLREQAEEALRREEYDPALGYIEQAIHLDTTNVDLQNLRSKVQAAKAEIEHLRQVMQRAENAHRAGNLDTAKQAIEEVMSRRPNDTRVKSLHRMIQKELDDRLRQKRMETLLETARKEMTNRHYTVALDILKEAEKVDPDAPTLRSLLETLTTARDQEQRRIALEQLTRQVEQAINTDDHQAALNLLAEGMQRFAGEPALFKLKDLAESQKQAAQTKSFVRERIAAAREILNAGNASGALKVLQEALKKAPGNPHLESLVSIAQERLVQDRDEQAKSRCIAQANDALGKRNYDEAIRILEAGQMQFTASPEIDNLLRFAREQQSKDAKKQDVENSVRRAQELLKNQEYDRAIELLESILARTPDEELGIVLEEARRRREALNGQIAAAITRGSQFLNEGSPAKAVEFLHAQPTSFRRSENFRELVQAAVNQNALANQKKAQEPPAFVPEPESEPEPDLEAPEPAKTMMWSSTAPPDEEEVIAPPPRVPTGRVTPTPPSPRVPTGRVTPTAPAPRVQTGRVTKTPSVPPPDAAGVATPGRFTKQHKLLAAAALGVVAFVVLVVVLWPSAKTGTLIVRSNADGADVLVDGRSRGTIGSAHELAIKLDEGHHQIRLQKEGYEPSSGEIDVAKGKEAQLPIDLTPSVVATGTLSVKTNEDGADVFVDGTLKGSTANGTLMLHIPTGSHEVRVDKTGFEKLAPQPVEIATNGEQQLKFPLVKSKTTANQLPADSYLIITGLEGAEVRVQGGDPPVSRLSRDTAFYSKVSPNSPHHVDVSLSGYETWSKDATAKPGDRLPLKAELKPIPVQKLAPKVVFFKGPTGEIPPGKAQISWETTNTKSVDIQGIGANLNPSDSKEVNVPETTTFTLVAKGDGGTSPETAITVNVKAVAAPKSPTISTFTPSATRIKPGESVTLTWTTADATSVTIDGTPVNPPASGTWTTSPAETTTYTLVANGAGNPAKSSPITVTVDKAPPPPPPPTNETAGINDALDRYKRAYQYQVVEELKKEWTGMTPAQEKGFREIFKDQRLKAVGVDLDACSTPIVSADAATATTTCTETTSFTADGRRKPSGKLTVAFSLRKSSGIWRVNTKLPTGK